jgi:hypothetical protein
MVHYGDTVWSFGSGALLYIGWGYLYDYFHSDLQTAEGALASAYTLVNPQVSINNHRPVE